MAPTKDPFLTTQQRLLFRTLTLLLQHTNSCDPKAVDPKDSIVKAHKSKPQRLRNRHAVQRKFVNAFMQLLLRDEETISVLSTRHVSHIRVASSTPTATHQPARDETPFPKHCIEVDRLLKDVHRSLARQAPSWLSPSFDGTIQRNEVKQFREYLVHSSHRRIRHRLDYGKPSSGRNIFWALTRPAQEIYHMPDARRSFDNVFYCRGSPSYSQTTVSNFTKDHVVLRPSDWADLVPPLLYYMDPSIARARLSYHCVLRFLLLRLDDALTELGSAECSEESRILNETKAWNHLRALYSLVRHMPDFLSVHLDWLQQVYNLEGPMVFPTNGPAAERVEFPPLAPLWPGQSHHLHAEAAELDAHTATGETSAWAQAAKSYLDLITLHESSLHTLTAALPETHPHWHAKITRAILGLKVDPVVYTPASPTAMLPISDVIGLLPASYHDRLVAWLHDNVPGFTSASLTESRAFPGSCHPEMQFASLRHLARLRRHPGRETSTAKCGIDLPSRKTAKMFRPHFQGLPTSQASCPVCRAVLTAFEGENGAEREGWRVTPAWHRSYQACDLPRWLPRHVGATLIKDALAVLEKRAERIYDGVEALNLGSVVDDGHLGEGEGGDEDEDEGASKRGDEHENADGVVEGDGPPVADFLNMIRFIYYKPW